MRFVVYLSDFDTNWYYNYVVLYYSTVHVLCAMQLIMMESLLMIK